MTRSVWRKPEALVIAGIAEHDHRDHASFLATDQTGSHQRVPIPRPCHPGITASGARAAAWMIRSFVVIGSGENMT